MVRNVNCPVVDEPDGGDSDSDGDSVHSKTGDAIQPEAGPAQNPSVPFGDVPLDDKASPPSSPAEEEEDAGQGEDSNSGAAPAATPAPQPSPKVPPAFAFGAYRPAGSGLRVHRAASNILAARKKSATASGKRASLDAPAEEQGAAAKKRK